MNYRRTLTRIITFLGGLYFFLEFMLPGEIRGVKISSYDEDISNGLITVSMMAIGLGIYNILAIHGSKIVFRRRGYGNSVALLIGLFMMLTVTFLDWSGSSQISGEVNKLFLLRDFAGRIQSDVEAETKGVLPFWQRNQKLADATAKALDDQERIINTLKTPAEASETDAALFASTLTDLKSGVVEARAMLGSVVVAESATKEDLAHNAALAQSLSQLGGLRLEQLNLTAKYSLRKKLYQFLYTGLFTALGAAMFSLLGFYIAAAAYRAFRIRSGESALMMLAAFLVMLGQIPFGLWIWSGFPEVRLWLLTTPSAAAFRAIKIGAGVAALVMAYRMWFSIESEEFTQKSEK